MKALMLIVILYSSFAVSAAPVTEQFSGRFKIQQRTFSYKIEVDLTAIRCTSISVSFWDTELYEEAYIACFGRHDYWLDTLWDIGFLSFKGPEYDCVFEDRDGSLHIISGIDTIARKGMSPRQQAQAEWAIMVAAALTQYFHHESQYVVVAARRRAKADTLYCLRQVKGFAQAVFLPLLEDMLQRVEQAHSSVLKQRLSISQDLWLGGKEPQTDSEEDRALSWLRYPEHEADDYHHFINKAFLFASVVPARNAEQFMRLLQYQSALFALHQGRQEILKKLTKTREQLQKIEERTIPQELKAALSKRPIPRKVQ